MAGPDGDGAGELGGGRGGGRGGGAGQVSDAATQLTWAYGAGRGAAFGGEWSYGLHAGCADAPGVACHFDPHFPGCGPGTGPGEVPAGEFEALPAPDFEAHPAAVVPAEYAGRGVFWWYTQARARPGERGRERRGEREREKEG